MKSVKHVDSQAAMDRSCCVSIFDTNTGRLASLSRLLEESGVSVVRAISDQRDLLNPEKWDDVDVIVVSSDMLLITEVQDLRNVSTKPIIAIIDEGDSFDVGRLSSVGVRGFISRAAVGDISLAIKVVIQGSAFIGDEFVSRLGSVDALTNVTPMPVLNASDLELLRFICKGFSSSVIGRALHKSPRTIEEHRTRLYRKFGVETKEELIIAAVQLQLI
jgi:two-component system response regulator NreC